MAFIILGAWSTKWSLAFSCSSLLLWSFLLYLSFHDEDTQLASHSFFPSAPYHFGTGNTKWSPAFSCSLLVWSFLLYLSFHEEDTQAEDDHVCPSDSYHLGAGSTQLTLEYPSKLRGLLCPRFVHSLCCLMCLWGTTENLMAQIPDHVRLYWNLLRIAL